MTIRSKSKIFGETNSPFTVTVESDLATDKYVISAGSRRVKSYSPGAKRIMITDAAGNASSFNYNQPNKLIGVNQNGQLTLFSQTPDTPPAGRVLVAEVFGATTPSGATGEQQVTLEAPYWYEVEVIGAGGGGGAGIGREALATNMLDGTNGGAGGYYKGLFAVAIPTIALLQAGNSGGRAEGIIFYLAGGTLMALGTNNGGAGGRTPILYSSAPGNGLSPVYDNSYSGPELKEGSDGINAGANGGESYCQLGDPGSTKGVGGSGGGANGPYGGKGGDSIIFNDNSTPNAGSGGGGGAGGGFGLAGYGGGHINNAVGYGGGGGGSGILKEAGVYTFSGGGGGGGGASRFVCGDIQIMCGGGGGGAGAGFGYARGSTNGSPGTNNIDTNIGGGNNGGNGGLGVSLLQTITSHDCKGSNGGRGIVRLWRCV